MLQCDNRGNSTIKRPLDRGNFSDLDFLAQVDKAIGQEVIYKIGACKLKNKEMTSPWSQKGWLDKAQAWVQDNLEAQEIKYSPEMEQIHDYPWSTIFRISSESGNLFFKATADVTAYEIAFSAYIKSINQYAMPDLIAVNPQEWWMIMRDGGQRLREQIQVDLDWEHWERLLPQYAALQIEASKDIDALLATGIPDRRLNNLSQLFRDVIANRALFQPDTDEALSDQDYQRLIDLVPVVAAKCKQLSAYAIPETIHHGDLHDGNIFYDGRHYTFYDWGDICLSHPCFSLRTAYVSAEIRFDLDEYSPELHRLRDAYLPVWREFETEENLLAAFDLAMELWAISSMLSWHQGISQMNAKHYEDYKHVLPSLAEELFTLIKV